MGLPQGIFGKCALGCSFLAWMLYICAATLPWVQTRLVSTESAKPDGTSFGWDTFDCTIGASLTMYNIQSGVCGSAADMNEDQKAAYEAGMGLLGLLPWDDRSTCFDTHSIGELHPSELGTGEYVAIPCRPTETTEQKEARKEQYKDYKPSLHDLEEHQAAVDQITNNVVLITFTVIFATVLVAAVALTFIKPKLQAVHSVLAAAVSIVFAYGSYSYIARNLGTSNGAVQKTSIVVQQLVKLMYGISVFYLSSSTPPADRAMTAGICFSILTLCFVVAEALAPAPSAVTPTAAAPAAEPAATATEP